MASMRQPTRGRVPGLALALALVQVAAGALTVGVLEAHHVPREQRPRFSARVDLVTLPVSVLDSDNLPVEELSPSDFVVLEDGIEQDVALLLNPREAPLDVALLMDVSDSMREIEETARSSALQFLDQLSDNDCVLLLRFTGVLGPGTWGKPGDQAVREAISKTPMQGGSAVRDAIAAGFYRLAHDSDRCVPDAAAGTADGEPPRRRLALVVVTDGHDEHSALTIDDAASVARQSGAPFFPVGIGKIAQSVWLRTLSQTEDRRDLEAMARVTGGQFIRAGKNAERLGAAYGEVIRWLRSYYLVGYYPPSSSDARIVSEMPSWHEVEVRVRRPGLSVHTREGVHRSSVDVAAAARHVQEGVNRLARGETDEAIIEFRLALESDPNSWEAYYHIGKTLDLAGRTEEAQRALLRAAERSMGRGKVHKLACLVSLALEDYEAAWDQVIRAHQPGIDTTVELMLLRQRSTPPANLEKRLHAPRIYVDHYRVFDLVERAAMRSVSLELARELSKQPELGLIDVPALADYRIFIKLKELSESPPYYLEADLELWGSADKVDVRGAEGRGERRRTGEPLHRRGVELTDIEDQEKTAAELAPHIAEILPRISGQQQ